MQDRLKCLSLKSDAGFHERRSDRVRWQDVECAFNERLRSGVITNLKNLDVTAFMKDAQALFESRINNALNFY